MAKVKASPKATSPVMPNTTRRGINLRPVASSAAGTADIGDLYVGQEAIGVLVGTDLARQWLDIETIDGVAVTTKTFCAAWLCDVTEVVVVVDPPLPPYDTTVVNSVTLDYNADNEIVGVWVNNIEFVQAPPPPPPVG
jgi:hypothetical protein